MALGQYTFAKQCAEPTPPVTYCSSRNKSSKCVSAFALFNDLVRTCKKPGSPRRTSTDACTLQEWKYETSTPVSSAQTKTKTEEEHEVKWKIHDSGQVRYEKELCKMLTYRHSALRLGIKRVVDADARTLCAGMV